MYVVRRAFRNYGQMMAPGSVVEPAAIKRFKSRVAEGRIVEVTEQNFSKWETYFKVRANATIQLPKPVEQACEELPEPTEHAPKDAPKVVPVVKIVSK